MREETLGFLNRVCTDLNSASAQVREETDALLADGNHVEVIKHFNQVRLAVAIIKEAREALKGIEDNLSKVAIPDIVAALRERTGEKPPFQIEGVGRVSVSYRYSCSMPDKEPGIQWLKDNGHGGLVQETVNSTTLSAFAKDLLENQGFELPADLFKVSTSPYTSITKAR